MRDGLDHDINEFNNFGFNINIAKFVNYHAKTQDLCLSVRNPVKTSPDYMNKPSSQLSHRNFRGASLYGDSTPTRTPRSLTSRKNFSMTCIDKSLTTVPCEIIQKQSILTVLDLSRNHFDEFPIEILEIQPLRILRIDYNRIKHIPSEITRLTELEALSISHNLLQKLPTNLGKLLNFRDLNVEANILETFPRDMVYLKNLKTLNLLQNKLSVFPCSFKELTRLKEFHFEWFKYASPSLDAYQRGDEGQDNLNKLRGKLAELYQKGEDGMSFENFISLFSVQKVNFKAINSQAQSILHLACLNEDMAVVRYLIREYPELLESIDDEGLTPLCLSLLKDKTKSALYLLKNGANIKAGRNYHGNPIHIAAKRLNYTALKEIIRLGENPNKIDNKGNTALHYAMSLLAEGQTKAGQIIQYLLDKGADPNAKSKENMTPVHLAVKRKECKAINWILSYNFEVQEIHGGGEIFNIDKRGGGYKWTALHLAAYNDAPSVVMELGEAQANLFKRSGNGYTPKMLMKQNTVTYKLLDKYEKEWIKKNVVFKRDGKQECLTSSNLKNLNTTREIKNASKNKFSETSFRHPEKTLKTKLEFYLPIVGKGIIFQNPHYENSFEICPESEAGSNSSIDDEDIGTLDDCGSEISEHVRVETDACATDLLFYTAQGQNNRLSFYGTLKDKGIQGNYQKLDIDIESMSAKLKSQPTLSYSECTEQAKAAQGVLLSETISISDKAQTLFGLKSLYFEIENYLSRKHLRPWIRESVPCYLLQELTKRTSEANSIKWADSTLAEIKTYYEIVPQTIIKVFSELEAPTYETQMLKITMLGMLADMKYFPAIDFLLTLLKRTEEPFMVLREGRRVYYYLQSLLQERAPEAKENQVRKERRSIFGL